MAPSTTPEDVPPQAPPPVPCLDPSPTYDSREFGGWYACSNCGYMVEPSLRGPLWRHCLPLVLLRPMSMAALVLVIPPAAPTVRN